MAVIFVLLPAALAFAGAALVVFIWAARSGQFDDLDTPGVRMLHDDVDPSRRSPSRLDADDRRDTHDDRGIRRGE